jgi:hypothetical protein
VRALEETRSLIVSLTKLIEVNWEETMHRPSLRRHGAISLISPKGCNRLLAARRTLQPTNQNDDADDRGSDADLDNAVPVEGLKDHGPVYASRFRCTAVRPMLFPALSRCEPPLTSAPLPRAA